MASDTTTLRPCRRKRARNLLLTATIILIIAVCSLFLDYNTNPDMDEITTTITRYPHISTLPPELVPNSSNGRRLIIIGDVHGHLKALRALLAEAEFSTSRDTVIFTGDMVNKGADSAGVVDLAMQIGAYGVRGNHEHRVLGAWRREHRRQQHRTNENKDSITNEEKKEEEDNTDEAAEEEEEVETHSTDLATASSLKHRHRTWLSSLPLILRIGNLGSRYGGRVLVVHAGLVPGVPLEKQDPHAVMNMRTLLSPRSRTRTGIEIETEPFPNQDQDQDQVVLLQTPIENENENENENTTQVLVPTPTRDGKPWAKQWTLFQKSLPRKSSRATVVYGHDAKAGLRMRRYAFGLDSGCAKGNKLTGVIFEVGDGDGAGKMSEYEDEDGSDWDRNRDESDHGDYEHARKKKKGPRIRHKLVSVSCAEAS
ncbi:Metallo-dependent phosphatase [Poronia punctata]|nr:Metallo-dependent phosphatase [Poronia punctata]